MEVELTKLYDTVSSIHDEMFFLRERYSHVSSNILEAFTSLSNLSRNIGPHLS